MAGVEKEHLVALRSHFEPKSVRGLASFFFWGGGGLPSVARRPALLLQPSLSPSFEAVSALPRETHHLHLANANYILSMWDIGVPQPERIMGNMVIII